MNENVEQLVCNKCGMVADTTQRLAIGMLKRVGCFPKVFCLKCWAEQFPEIAARQAEKQKRIMAKKRGGMNLLCFDFKKSWRTIMNGFSIEMFEKGILPALEYAKQLFRCHADLVERYETGWAQRPILNLDEYRRLEKLVELIKAALHPPKQ
jgi:hypothetical protein